MRVLALDNRPSSACVLLLTVQGHLPAVDLAIYTGTEKDRLKADLVRLQQIAFKAGIPIIFASGPAAEAIRAKIWQTLGEPVLVPDHVVAEVVFGACLEEIHQAVEPDVPYLRYVYPLLDLGWSRRDCDGYLHSVTLAGSGKAERWRRGWSR